MPDIAIVSHLMIDHIFCLTYFKEWGMYYKILIFIYLKYIFLVLIEV